MTCKKCTWINTRRNFGRIDKNKLVIKEPVTEWFCGLMEKGSQDDPGGKLHDFEPCSLYSSYE